MLSGRSQLIHKIEFYGQDAPTPSYAHQVGKSGQVVLTLTEAIPGDRNFKLFFDNWFNSPGLKVALALRGIWNSEFTIQIYKNWSYSPQWYDNKPVTLLSTFCAAEPEVTLWRYERATRTHLQVPAPQAIQMYNKHAGVLWRSQLVSRALRVARHFRKRAYLKIFVNLVNIVATNSWVQHRRDSDLKGIEKKQQLSLYDFKASLAESMSGQNDTPCPSALGTSAQASPN